MIHGHMSKTKRFMKIFLILETFAIPSLELSCQSCRLCSLAADDVQLQFRSCSSQALQHSRADGQSGGPRRNGTEEFPCSSQKQSWKYCGVASATIALQTWQLSEKTTPLLPMSMSAVFDFRKGEKQCFELPRTKYFQNFISTGKVKLF